MNAFSKPYGNSILALYRNGNYYVRLYKNGTKIRYGKGNFYPDFPENIDLKITSYCDGGCPMCHENSSTNGAPCDFSLPFFDTLAKGTELAIGGGNPLSHPKLESFLGRMKKQGVICNITVRQTHLFREKSFVQRLIDEKLVYGVGISFTEASDELFSFCKKNENAVIHLIAGIHSAETLEALADKNLKILLLAFKHCGRGKNFYTEETKRREEELKNAFYGYIGRFSVISLDGAAAEWLEVQKHVFARDYALHNMGNEGEFTMYIDAVAKKFSVNSITREEARYQLSDDIRSMFHVVREKV